MSNVDQEDAEWLPHHLDGKTGAVEYIRITLEQHRAATFLSDEYLTKNERRSSTVQQMVDTASRPNAPAHGPARFIFHAAFCCSTLLARALDIEDVSFGLKEPIFLNDLANLRRAGLTDAQLLPILSAAITQFERPIDGNRAMVVKPSNIANNLIAPTLELRPQSKALLLFAPLPVFLRSVAKKGMWGRIWARRLYFTIRSDTSANFGFSEAEIFEQTDLQIAALGWLVQMHQFGELVAADRNGQIRTLDSEHLLANKVDVLGHIAAHFDLPLDSEAARNLAGSDVFSQDSKSHEAGFDSQTRQASHEEVENFAGEEIQMICQWAAQVAEFAKIKMKPGARL